MPNVRDLVIKQETGIHLSVRWRAIFAGTLVAIFTYTLLMSLGIAIAGGQLTGIIQGDNSASALGIGSAIWTILSVLVSLFAGGFIAGQVGGLVTMQVGRVHGLVVATLFFGILFSQLGSAVSSIGGGVGKAVGAVGSASGDLASTPEAEDLMNSALGELNLRSSPEVVAKGVATRLVRGKDDSAINYLAYQAKISPSEARAKVATIKTGVTRAATDAGVAASKAIKIAGWTLFGALFLGAIASILGGGVGAMMTLRDPVSNADYKAANNGRVAS
jgi:hypothetical protein